MDLCPGCTVGELEEAGKHAVVFRCVNENGVLEIHSMRDDVIVFIHPLSGWGGKKNSLDMGVRSQWWKSTNNTYEVNIGVCVVCSVSTATDFVTLS